ncbi:MAG: hypothetical protein CSA96_08810 [Bacteroidetes bacterium]|nr:MAG: hypothetical protein CSA96_08810 [Bacteroidota bacterium]
MRKKQLILLLLIPASLCLNAQRDPRAEPYLQALSEQFNMEEGYLIRMNYIREDVMRGSSSEGEGRIWMKGTKYKMAVDEYVLHFDGEKLYSHNAEAEEVYISVPDPGDPAYLQAVPIRIIKACQQDFKYQLIGERPFRGKDRIEIQLYPLDPSGPYSMLKIFLNPQSLKLEAFLLKHKEGIEYTMLLEEIKGRQQLDEAMFRFNPEEYPNTDIIELID